MRMRRAAMAALINNVGTTAAATIGTPVNIGTFVTVANSTAGSLTVPSEIPSGATVFGFLHIASSVLMTNVADEDVADWDASNGTVSSYVAASGNRIYFFQRKLSAPLAASSVITFTKDGSARMHGVAQYVTGLADTPLDVVSTGTSGTDGEPTNSPDPTNAVSQLIVTGTISVFGTTDVFTDDVRFSNPLALADNSSIRMSSMATSSGSAVVIDEALTNGGSPSTRLWIKLSAVLKGA